MARDNNLYGQDENSWASSIAGDALGRPEPANISGNAEARSKGNDPDNEDPTAKAETFTGTEKAKKSEGN